jgi:DNA polymerase-3 subunit alpha
MNALLTDPEAKPQGNRTYKVAGLVTQAQERTTKAGKSFGQLVIEDYTGKLELTLWSEDYGRYNPFLKQGLIVYITGNIQPNMRYAGDQQQVQDGYKFKITYMQLLETLRAKSTRSLELSMHPAHIKPHIIDFMAAQFKKKAGPVTLKMRIRDSEKNYEVELTAPKGLELTDELANFLMKEKTIETRVIVGGEN